jgi:uroporphyrinogen-III decarboxylase
VHAEALACIAAGGTEGRFVLGSACAVPRYTPVENMRALARAALG